MKKEVIKAYDEMIEAQERFLETKDDSDMETVRKAEAAFDETCRLTRKLSPTQKEIDEKRLSDLKRAERNLAIALGNTKGLYKSKYKHTGDVEADIIACRRELDEVFSFLNSDLFD